MTSAPLFVLDGPHYHAVRPGSTATFRGVALAVGSDSVAEVVASSAGRAIGRARPDGASPELGWIPLAGSSACRFALDLPVPRGARIDLSVRFASGAELPVFRYDVSFAERLAERLRALDARVAGLPVPDADLVTTTQGLGNVEAYRASILGSFLAMESLLGAAGASPRGVRSVLDVGCGTGRLLVGWHVDDPRRHLVGTDLNPDLIAWARANLGSVATWDVNGLRPPLPYAGGSFDLVVLASVFTHLALESQKAWLGETRRLLAPDGHALVTLHGKVYADVLLGEPAAAARFSSMGYAELAGDAEGANGYTTFHTEGFARALFSDFSRVAFFPRGVTGEVADAFPVASLQDVYVLRR
ncbi:MAG: class I SAM-dependent methyltransferase [Thermoanaerobaculia bacterium]|jgi:SAM-dependent methyltransferase